MKRNLKQKKSKNYSGKGPIRRPTRLRQADGYFIGSFEAMGGPCEILVDTDDGELAGALLKTAAWEAWRIEQKFSRYRKDNIVRQINAGSGKTVKVDEETARLLDFAGECHELSGGMFDVTSGVLRRAWKFDGSNRLPEPEVVQSLLPLVGWHKVVWEKPLITLPTGMEIDLGGIGKEYAVDRTLLLARGENDSAILINFGGDIYTGGVRENGLPWSVGVEGLSGENGTGRLLKISKGGLATSGDSRRFLLKDGKRYSHVLNPKSGWPVEDAPRSVTVTDDTCTKAGILATLALLHGPEAEEFLEEQSVRYWCVR